MYAGHQLPEGVGGETDRIARAEVSRLATRVLNPSLRSSVEELLALIWEQIHSISLEEGEAHFALTLNFAQEVNSALGDEYVVFTQTN